MDIDELVRRYIVVRDAKDQMADRHKKEIAKLADGLKKLESMLLTALNESGAESTRTKNGTAYKKVVTSVRVVDRTAYLEFVAATGDFDFLESKANKTAVEAYMEAHEGDLPPGVTINRIATVGVRRS